MCASQPSGRSQIILTMHYFLFVLAAAALYWLGKMLWVEYQEVHNNVQFNVKLLIAP